MCKVNIAAYGRRISPHWAPVKSPRATAVSDQIIQYYAILRGSASGPSGRYFRLTSLHMRRNNIYIPDAEPSDAQTQKDRPENAGTETESG